MYDDIQNKMATGFAPPESYSIEDRGATFKLAIAILICSTTAAAVLAGQIAGLI